MSILKSALARAAYPPKNRRIFPRYQLPLWDHVEVRWNGDVVPLRHDILHENVSAGGLCLCLGDGAPPPVGAELDIRFRPAEGPLEVARRFLRCQAWVLRHEEPGLMAVRFERVTRVREERGGNATVGS